MSNKISLSRNYENSIFFSNLYSQSPPLKSHVTCNYTLAFLFLVGGGGVGKWQHVRLVVVFFINMYNRWASNQYFWGNLLRRLRLVSLWLCKC